MTADRLNTVSGLLKTVGIWALSVLVGWFALEAREVRSSVQAARMDQAVLAERVLALSERVKEVEKRLDRHEDREGKR